MKSIILFFISITLINTHTQGQIGNQTHTFLVKTDLTKEQVQALLNQYHQNQHQNKNQVGATTVVHHNSTTTLVQDEEKTQLHINEQETDPNRHTTQLKVKKEKHQKNKKEKGQQETVPEVPEVPEAEETTETGQTEQVNLKKIGKKEKNKNENKAPKAEVVETPEVPEAPEAPEAPEIEQTEQVNLKKKGKIEKNKKEPEMPEKPEAPEAPEIEQTEQVNLKKKGKKEKNENEVQKIPETPEVENEQKNTLLVNGTSVEEQETEKEAEDTIILAQKNSEQTPKQNSNKLFGFFSAILFTFIFVSLFVYSTQPKKNSKSYIRNFKELTDYLLIKEKNNKEYELGDF